MYLFDALAGTFNLDFLAACLPAPPRMADVLAAMATPQLHGDKRLSSWLNGNHCYSLSTCLVHVFSCNFMCFTLDFPNFPSLYLIKQSYKTVKVLGNTLLNVMVGFCHFSNVLLSDWNAISYSVNGYMSKAILYRRLSLCAPAAYENQCPRLSPPHWSRQCTNTQVPEHSYIFKAQITKTNSL